MDQIRSRSLPERPRRYRFALTPLADAMFQLLIFFMLSTSLTPYSLITLRTSQDAAVPAEAGVATGGPANPSAPAPSAAPEADPDVTTWVLGEGVVTMGSQTFEIDQLPDLAMAIGSRDNPGTVVIAIGPTARVQDVATAMEALEQGEIARVQITKIADGGP